LIFNIISLFFRLELILAIDFFVRDPTFKCLFLAVKLAHRTHTFFLIFDMHILVILAFVKLKRLVLITVVYRDRLLQASTAPVLSLCLELGVVC